MQCASASRRYDIKWKAFLMKLSTSAFLLLALFAAAAGKREIRLRAAAYHGF
jgi:hypothetical protein